MTYSTVFDSISHQLGLGVPYPNTFVETGRRIRVNKGRIPLRQLLDDCLRPLQLTYAISDQNIWINKLLARMKLS